MRRHVTLLDRLFPRASDYHSKGLRVSQHSPNQPSPYATAPETAGQASKSGGLAVLIIGLVVGGVFVVLVCGGLAVALLLPAVSNARTAAQQMSQEINMRMVGLALHNYHAAHKQLPCTVSTDADGKVVSTWRTALVPFFDESWSTNPTPATTSAPQPLRKLAPATASETDVFAIVSPNGMFSSAPNAVVRFSDVADGLNKTVMAVKLPNRSTDWSSTNELTPDEAFGAIQSITKPESGFWIMGDGAVVKIVLPLDRKTFDGLISRAGGEPLLSY